MSIFIQPYKSIPTNKLILNKNQLQKFVYVEAKPIPNPKIYDEFQKKMAETYLNVSEKQETVDTTTDSQQTFQPYIKPDRPRVIVASQKMYSVNYGQEQQEKMSKPSLNIKQLNIRLIRSQKRQRALSQNQEVRENLLNIRQMTSQSRERVRKSRIRQGGKRDQSAQVTFIETDNSLMNDPSTRVFVHIPQEEETDVSDLLSVQALHFNKQINKHTSTSKDQTTVWETIYNPNISANIPKLKRDIEKRLRDLNPIKDVVRPKSTQDPLPRSYNQSYMFVKDDRDRFGKQLYPKSNSRTIETPDPTQYYTSVESIEARVSRMNNRLHQKELIKFWQSANTQQ